MNGQDMLKALNDIDMELIEAAEYAKERQGRHQNRHQSGEQNRVVKRSRYGWAGLAAAAALVAVVGAFYHQAEEAPQEGVILAEGELDAPYEITHVESDNTYLFTAIEPVAAGSLEKDNTESGSQSVVSEVEWSGTTHEDHWKSVPGEVSYSLHLQRALSHGQERIQEGEVSEEQLYYLVEIEINNADLQRADNGVKEAEYKRLTEEYGYDLTWVAPGGYVIPDAYTYCLGCGRMYGALTEEQLENFPAKSEYSYGCLLTSQEFFSFAEYPYKETVTEEEMQKSLQIALDALDNSASGEEASR